ncbi:MAG: M23 family metallopeptidase [Clostridia bacterium]|nr:M23 family metallopeptidase [Clostridia bacterium]
MEKSNKLISFIKRNAVYIVVALCILAVGLTVTFSLLANDRKSITVETPIVNDTPVDETPVVPDIPVDKPVEEIIEFMLPVANYTSIEHYSDTMVFNSTLKRYSAHKATDFIAPEGSKVYCVWNGKVESIENTLLQGVSITVDHGNGLKTVYNSLADGDTVKVGQTLKKGDVIGEVSATNRQESFKSAHLHFEVVENGNSIDPIKYMVLEEK